MGINGIFGSKSILINKYSVLGVTFLLTQLLLSASSNFILADIGVSIAKGETSPTNYIIRLSIYVGLLLLAEFPNIFSKLNFDKAVFLAQQKYVALFSDTHKNKTILNAETMFKENQAVWLMNRSNMILHGSLGIFYNVAMLGLGVLLNISAISIAGDGRLIIGYMISFLIMYLAVNYFKKDLSPLIEKSNQDKVYLAAILQSGWDNIVIGNEYNWKNWWKIFMERLTNANNSSVNELLKQNSSEFKIRILVTLPAFIGTCILIMIDIDHSNNLIPLLMTLPIQMRAIPEICAVATYMNLWNKMSIELDLLINSIYAPEKMLSELANQPENRIKWELLTFISAKQKLQFNAITEIINYLSKIKNCRLCIRGPNQSGKSTISSLLKQNIANAIYIPTNSKLSFNRTFEASTSTGQKMLYQLEEIFNLISESDTGQVLILDEWDANLDNATLIKVSKLINTISEKHKIVEIRHREDALVLST